jgi:hypothetical protein
MEEIESSSRLYREEEALYLTANFLYGVDGGEYGSTPITFVLTNGALVSVRYQTPKAFTVFTARCQRNPALVATPGRRHAPHLRADRGPPGRHPGARRQRHGPRLLLRLPQCARPR